MKKLIIAVLVGLFLVGCGKSEAPASINNIGVKYSDLVDGIALPMNQAQNSVDGAAMAGSSQNQDGGLITLYAAVDHGMVTKARLVIMPSQKGDLPSDAANLRTMLQALHNAAPTWGRGQDWFASAFHSAHTTPNKRVTGMYMGNEFSVIEVPELRSFELEISPAKS
jgi:hypothetical protein